MTLELSFETCAWGVIGLYAYFALSFTAGFLARHWIVRCREPLDLYQLK